MFLGTRYSAVLLLLLASEATVLAFSYSCCGALNSLRATVKSQQVTINILVASLQAVNIKMNSLTTVIQTLQPSGKTGTQVAFTAQFSAYAVTKVPTHGIYTFDKAITNIGDGYDTTTGIFTAPVRGLYVFFFKMMSCNYQPWMEAEIDKDSVVLGYVWADGKSDNNDQGSVMVTTHMDKGDRVWVKHRKGSTGIYGHSYTVFSGVLVQEG